MTIIGFLHPGQMGVTLAAAVAADAIWAGDGRSPATRQRASSAEMTDVESVAELCRMSDIVLSICPPAAARDVANAVKEVGFTGIYVDANAISPATAKEIGRGFEAYVDGGIIGPPAMKPGTTRMYLAGAAAADVAALWHGSALDVRVLPGSADDAPASALKMAYAGWTKGRSALLLAVNALAGSAGVLDALHDEWTISQPGAIEQSQRTAAAVGPKAWRFSGEMVELAAAMADAGLPDGFHRGAAALYERLAGFKSGEPPTLATVIEALSTESADNDGD